MNHAYMPHDVNLYTNLESDRLVVNVDLLVYLLPRRKLFFTQSKGRSRAVHWRLAVFYPAEVRVEMSFSSFS